MSIQILIGGNDYTGLTDLTTVKVDSNIAVNSDTAEFTVNIPSQELPRPKGGQEVKILNGGNIEFGGVVQIPEETALTPTIMSYDVKCRDYTYWLDKRLVVESYYNTPAGTIIKDIVSQFTSGFTTNNVQGTGTTFNIPYIKFDHITVSEAFKKICDATGYDWWVDYNKDIHFAPMGTSPSPLPNNTLMVDTDLQNYGDLVIDEDVSQVRNQIYFLGQMIAASYTITQKFSCDGNTTSFALNYQPQTNISKMVIKVGTTSYTPKHDLSDGQASNTTNDGNAYVHQTNQTVRFNVAPASGQVLSVTYYPRYEMVNMYNDPNAMYVMKQRDLQDGIYEYMIRDTQLSGDDTSLVDTRGRIELIKYANPHYSGTFNSFLQGWATGQYFYMTSSYRMDGYFQKFQFYIVKLEKTIVNHPQNGTPLLIYAISFSDSPYVY